MLIQESASHAIQHVAFTVNNLLQQHHLKVSKPTKRDAESIKQFKSMINNFFSLNQIFFGYFFDIFSLFLIHAPVGVKLLTRLWLQFSHLNEHKFRHSSKDCVSPMCNCGAEIETTSHFFLLCQFFANERQKLRDDNFDDSKNKQILLHTICYIQATKRFERPLIDQC